MGFFLQALPNGRNAAADVPVWLADAHHTFFPDDSDRPPVASGGQDRVVQPQDTVTLSGIASKDDKKIVSYLWQMLTAYPYAIIEVTRGIKSALMVR